MWFNQFLNWIYFSITTYLLCSLLGASYSEPYDNATGQSILWSALFEDEKVHCVLCLNMVILLNILLCNAVLNFGKRRKSHMLNVVSREGQKGPGMCWHNSSSALHSAGRVWIWWQPSVCSDCLWDCSKLIQMQSQHVSNFMDRGTSDSSYFHVLLIDWHPSTGHTTFDLGKMLKICVLPISCSLKLLLTFLKFL